MDIDLEIELEGGNALAFFLIAILILLPVFGLVGRFVIPIPADQPQLLTPARWTTYKLQKVANRETKTLVQDAGRLHDLLVADTPDPVEAMLVAQDIYATHETGSSAPASARGALIAAAEATVQAASGEISRDEAIVAYNTALERLEALTDEDIKPKYLAVRSIDP